MDDDEDMAGSLRARTRTRPTIETVSSVDDALGKEAWEKSLLRTPSINSSASAITNSMNDQSASDGTCAVVSFDSLERNRTSPRGAKAARTESGALGASAMLAGRTFDATIAPASERQIPARSTRFVLTPSCPIASVVVVLPSVARG